MLNCVKLINNVDVQQCRFGYSVLFCLLFTQARIERFHTRDGWVGHCITVYSYGSHACLNVGMVGEHKGAYFDCASLTCAPRLRVALVHTGIVALWPTGARTSIRGQLVALQSNGSGRVTYRLNIGLVLGQTCLYMLAQRFPFLFHVPLFQSQVIRACAALPPTRRGLDREIPPWKTHASLR